MTRAGLVKKPIVDSTGRRTSVWVKMGDKTVGGEWQRKKELKEVGKKKSSNMSYKEAKEKHKDLKVSEKEMKGKWDKKPNAYFRIPKGSVMVDIKDVKPTRQREEGVENGRKYMALAMQGKMGKRKPLSVEKNKDGTYKLLDGNSTYFLSKNEIGLNRVPVQIQ